MPLAPPFIALWIALRMARWNETRLDSCSHSATSWASIGEALLVA